MHSTALHFQLCIELDDINSINELPSLCNGNQNHQILNASANVQIITYEQ